jgi:hypothetical protein
MREKERERESEREERETRSQSERARAAYVGRRRVGGKSLTAVTKKWGTVFVSQGGSW